MGATYSFVANTNNYADAASQAKFEALTGMSVKMRCNGAALLPAEGERWDYSIMNGKSTAIFSLYADTATTLQYVAGNSNDGYVFSSTFLRSAINSAKDYAVCYTAMQTPSQLLAGYIRNLTDNADVSGSEITLATNHGAWTTAAGSGVMQIGSNFAKAPGGRIDAIAVYSTTLTGADRYAKPSTGDTGIVALYWLDDAAGTSFADATGGTSLTITGGGTWNTNDGAWDTAAAGAAVGSLVNASPLLSLTRSRLAGG
jgi:hypothetical protein